MFKIELGCPHIVVVELFRMNELLISLLLREQ